MGVLGETKAIKLNPDIKSGLESIRWSHVNWQLLYLVPSVVLCTPLDATSEAERGLSRLDNPGPPYISPRHTPRRVSLHSRLIATAQRGRQQFTGYKSISIGVEKRTPRVAFGGGRVHRISLDSYRPPQAGHPPVS